MSGGADRLSHDSPGRSRSILHLFRAEQGRPSNAGDADGMRTSSSPEHTAAAHRKPPVWMSRQQVGQAQALSRNRWDAYNVMS